GFTNYSLTIKAGTVAGFGPSITVTAVTDEAAPSSTPINTIATVLSSTGIKLSWQPPVISDRNGVITAYEIDYKITGSNVTMSASASGSTLTYTINNLKAYTNYSLTIKAGTVAGFGPSITVTVVTDEAAPSTSPSITTVTLTNNNTIKINWKAIPENEKNGIISGYYLILSNTKLGSTSNRTILVNQISLSGNTRSLIATDLDYYSRYSVAIQGFTSAGIGPLSSLAYIMTLQSVPSKSVINIVASMGSSLSTSVSVSWQPPAIADRNGIITHYRIEYNNVGRARFRRNVLVHLTTSNITRYTLTNLTPLRNYSIRVAASTLVGFGPYSTPIFYQTFDAVSPEVLVSPQSITTVADSNITLRCEGYGEPVPTIEWLKNGQKVGSIYTIRRISNSSSLTIYKAALVDSGTYRCNISNIKNFTTTDAAQVIVNDNNIDSYCNAIIEADIRWPKTFSGQIATAFCPPPSQGTASRICNSFNSTHQVFSRINTANCLSPQFEAISNMSNTLDKEGQNGTQVAINKLDNAISLTSGLKGADMKVAINLLAKINQVSNTVTPPLLEKFATVQSKLLNASNANQLKDSQQLDQAVQGNSSIMDVLENMADKVVLSENTTEFVISTPVLELKVYKVTNTTTTSGFELSTSTANTDSSSSDNLVISLAKELFQRKNYDKITLTSYTSLDRILPSATGNNSTDITRVVINSKVFSISLQPKPPTPLPSEFRFTISNKNAIANENNSLQSQCTYWDCSESNCKWSSAGCRVGPESNASQTVCYCNHMTTFASLLIISNQTEPSSSFTLHVITYVGCGIAILCALLALITCCIFWRQFFRTLDVIRINLFLSVMISHILVISGLIQIQHKPLCVAISVALHLSILMIFSWQLVEQIYIYKLLTNGFDSKFGFSPFMAIGFILPGLLAILTAVITVAIKGINFYLNGQVCWLSTSPPIFLAYVIPIGVMILLTAAVVFRSTQVDSKGNQKLNIDRTANNAGIMNIRRSKYAPVLLLPVFGIGWITFAALVILQRTDLQYVFAIASMLQGILIFVFYCCINCQNSQVENISINEEGRNKYYKASITGHDNEHMDDNGHDSIRSNSDMKSAQTNGTQVFATDEFHQAVTRAGEKDKDNKRLTEADF
ncbi:Down syndrome cell adhesion molecule-like protein, partial [Trichoplax sp. H2]